MGLKDKTLYMIGNAHIDPVWLWRWEEGFQEVKATFRSALDRMNEFDDFVFTASSAALYEWVEHSDPAMFAEIRQRVAEGRWQIIGGWWMEPDCNIPSGESFVRQGLYGQRYFKEKFGVIASIGYNPDSFGHNGTLPQILKKSGLDSYIFMRPGPHEKGLPAHLFWWEANDGSRVLAFRIHYAYCAWPADISQHVLACVGAIKAPFDSTLCFYGVGNHGGGPTVANLECIRQMDADPAFPHLVLGGVEKLLDPTAARAWPLPVVHDELQHHASGCYSAHSAIKSWNRQAENLLLAAEKWAVVAQRVTGQPYPADLDRAWKNVLFNQFHDILAGSAIEAAYDDAHDLYGEAQAIGGRALNYALQALAWNVRVEPQAGIKPIVVFNPHAWPVRANVELEYGDLHDGDELQDESDRPVALQTVQSSAAANGRARLSFLAELPPLGYRTYRMLPGTPAGQAAATSGSTAGQVRAKGTENVLENIARAPNAWHDVHGPWEYQGPTEQYTLYNQGRSLFHSEFGAEGYTNEHTIEAHIAPANRWSATRDNPVYFHTAAWQVTSSNTGNQATIGLWLEDDRPLDAAGAVYFSNNYLLPLPGESQTIAAEWQNVSEPDRRLLLQGWNISTAIVS